MKCDDNNINTYDKSDRLYTIENSKPNTKIKKINIGILCNIYDFYLDILEALKNTDIHILYVITNNKKIIDLVNNKIPYIYIKNYVLAKENDCKNLITKLLKKTDNKLPDFQLTYSFPKIHKELYSKPEGKTLNVHYSLLPSYKGPNPIEWIIHNKEKQTGVSISYICDEGCDNGNLVALSKPIEIDYDLQNVKEYIVEKSRQECIDLLKNIFKKFNEKNLVLQTITSDYKPSYYGKFVNW